MSYEIAKSSSKENIGKTKHRIGLVLDGGGAKGAYQIGVWRALRKTGLEQYVTDIAGTSVGGLNAALFVKGDLEEAERIWANEISTIKLFEIADGVSELIKKYLPDMSIFEEVKPYHNRPMNCFITTYKSEGKPEDDYTVPEGDHIKEVVSGKAVYFNMRFLSPKERSVAINNAALPEKVLLATSALPVLCRSIKMGGNHFRDGGVVDNSPVYPLLEAKKCDTIITIHLNPDTTNSKQKQAYANIYEQEGVSVLEIVPSQDTLSFIGTLNFSKEAAQKLMELGYNDTKKAFDAIVKNWTKESLFAEDGEKVFTYIEHLSPEDKYRLYNECEFLVRGNYAKLNYISETGFGKVLLRIIRGGGIKAKKQILANTVELQQKMMGILVCLDDEMQNMKQGMHYLFYRSLTISDILLAQHIESKKVFEILNELIARNEHNEQFLADKFSDYVALGISSAQKQLEELTAGIDARIAAINEINAKALEIHEAQVEAVAKRISEAKQHKIVRFAPEKAYIISSDGVEEKLIDSSSNCKSLNMIDKENFFKIFNECSSSAIILPEGHKHPPAKIIYPSDYYMYLWFVCTPISERAGKKVCMVDFHDKRLYFHGYKVNDDGSNYIELQPDSNDPIWYHKNVYKIYDKIKELFTMNNDDDILFYKTFGDLRDPKGKFETTLKVLKFKEANPEWEKNLAEDGEEMFVNFVDRFISKVYD